MLLRCRLAAACAVLLFACAGARAQVLIEPVGTTSPVQTATVTVTTAGTVGAINVLTKGAPNLDFNFVSGGTCAVGTAYAANATCTVEYTFKPTAPGARYGGITLTSGNTLLATAYVSGTGTGPQVNFPPGILSKVASGFNQPGGMAFDGSGNLFVADNSDGRVMELIAATGYTTSTAISTGITQPYMVALDGVGNLFYTDDFSVIELYAVGGYKTSVTLDSFGLHPDSIAVDGNGNVFVTDNGNLIEILAAGGYSTIITRPAGVLGCLAIDSSGNVFVASFYLSQMKEFFVASGYTTTNTFPLTIPYVASIAVDDNDNVFAIDNNDSTLRELFVASGYTTQAIFSLPSLPGAMALDATGNVFFSDSTIRGVYKLDFADPPTLNFATTPVGQTSTDSPQTVTLLNSGNAPLTISTPGNGTNPSISAGFTLGNSSTCPQISASAAPATLAVGSSCTDVVSFQPVAAGAITGQLVTIDNALGGTQTIPLTGNGLVTPTTATLTASPNPVVLGSGVTLTATVAPNPASTTVPTGTVTFYLGGTSGTSLGTVTLSNGGLASLTTVPLPFGNDSVTCVYSGDSNFSGSTCNAVTVSVINPTLFLREPVGTSSGTIMLAVTVTVPGTLSGIHVVTQGATGLDFSLSQLGSADGLIGGCGNGATFTAGQTCALGFQFKPTRPGQRLGAITLVSTTGTLMGTTYLSGTGVGPQVTFPPGVQSVLSTTFSQPTSIAVDGSGDVFVGNTSSTGCTVTELPAGGKAAVVIASGFSEVDGIAIDGAGNLFVVDRSKTKVTEFFAANSYASAMSFVIPYAFSQPYGIAVDANGNLYVSDASSVLELPFSNGYKTATNVGSGYSNPGGLAVDANGDVFVADQSNLVIKEVLAVNGTIPAAPTIKSLPVNVTSGSPISLTIDGVGNLFVGSFGTGPVEEIFASAGYTTSMSLGSGYLRPDGLVVDGSGNLFVADTGNGHVVKIDLADPPTLSFATTVVGSTSSDSPQTVTFYNDGNAPLADPPLGPVGIGPSITPGFTLGAGSTCPYVAAGASCVEQVSFTPVTAGNPISGKLVTYDDNLNAASATQTVPLSGIALTALPQTITFPQPATPAYAGTSALLNATASSGLPVTFSIVSGPATVNGSLVTYTGAGMVVIEADQAGNGTYAAAAPVQQSVTVKLLSVPVGTKSVTVTTTVTIATAGTLGAINVLTQGTPNLDFNFVSGGTCVVGTAYTVGQTCTVEYTFTPTHPGLRFGGISLVTSGSVLLGDAYIYGLGTGPQVIYSPAAQSLLGGTYSYPTGVAVDASGDVFLTDENANAVYEIPAGGGASFSLGTFPAPDDVAVDGSGNVFVIYNRTTLAEIEAVNGKVSGSSAVNVISTNFSGLDGMKVDGNGNVYLAEGVSGGTGMIQEVLAVNGSIPANPTVLTLVSSNIGEPTGVAVDAAGDVFISDQLGNAFEALAVGGVIPATPTIVTLASGLNIPTNIALDAAGDVFVSLEGSVAEIVAVNGTVPTNPTILNLGTNIVFAQGLAVDASGNVYVADDGTPYAIKLDFADAPSLTFATTQVGSTSTDSPQTVTVTNDGNADLTFLPPVSGTNPSITTNYTFTSTCPKLAAGTNVAYAIPESGSCAESISFTPVTAGLDSGELTLTDNNLNVANAQQNILLNATGTIAPTALTLTSSANPTYALQPVTFTVHLTTNGQGDAGQNVTLIYTVGTLVVTAGLTTDSTGTASYTVSGGFDPGSYAVSAAFAGTTSYQASSASLTEVVSAIPTTSTLTVFPTQPLVNTNIVLTAVVTPQLSGPPTGLVVFYNGTTMIGTGPVSNSGVAQFTIASLPAGNYTFGCTYSGATDYASSVCAPIAETVELPPDFSLTATPPTITIETQHHKTMQLTLTPIGLFSGPVYLGCQGPLPPYLTCELPSSETLAVGQAVTFNFTMDTDALLNFLAKNRPAAKTPWTDTPNAPARMALALLLPLALAGFARRRKTLCRVLLLVVLVVGATALTACGDKWPAHTPPGTYTIPVVGTGTTSGGTVITHTLNITLTVTP